MRKILISMLVLLMTMPAWAQNCLTVTQKNGEQFSFTFTEKPVISYTESDVVITTAKAEVRYAIESIRKFTFDENPTAVEPVQLNRSELQIDEETVTISGSKANMEVRVIDLQGKVLLSFKTDRNGSLAFSLSSLSAGTYIITSETITCKILKK